MITLQESTIDSSMIKRAFYNFVSNVLTIEYSSGVMYEYSNVPTEVYDEFCKAESHGKFINEKIKGTYNYTKIEE